MPIDEEEFERLREENASLRCRIEELVAEIADLRAHTHTTSMTTHLWRVICQRRDGWPERLAEAEEAYEVLEPREQ